MSELNRWQLKVLELLNARQDRDIYECGDAQGLGNGRYRVTYAGGESYEALSYKEVHDMEKRGLIEKRYPGCYKLFGAERRDSRGVEIR